MIWISKLELNLNRLISAHHNIEYTCLGSGINRIHTFIIIQNLLTSYYANLTFGTHLE